MQTKDNDLNYLINSAFRNINRLFVLSLKNGDDDPTRNSCDEYYIPLLEIKGFDTLIDNKPFSEHPVKSKQEVYEKLAEMSRNNDYTTGNLLDYLYNQNYYKRIDIDLSRQTNMIIPQQINFTRTLE